MPNPPRDPALSPLCPPGRIWGCPGLVKASLCLFFPGIVPNSRSPPELRAGGGSSSRGSAEQERERGGKILESLLLFFFIIIIYFPPLSPASSSPCTQSCSEGNKNKMKKKNFKGIFPLDFASVSPSKMGISGWERRAGGAL